MTENILVVGCGGLGCELIKILSLDTNNKLTIVDDDTIDYTNLNRQFFFTKVDVGKSKSEVVANKLLNTLSVNTEDKQLTAIFGRIDDYKLMDFYKQFDVVYNCLDNNEARSFVNQMCHISGTVMIDGGSAGWLGQSFHNGKECFDCLPKKFNKIYPVCTIRQKPKNFEHCLVWAKAIIENDDDLEFESMKEDLEFLQTGYEENLQVNDDEVCISDEEVQIKDIEHYIDRESDSLEILDDDDKNYNNVILNENNVNENSVSYVYNNNDSSEDEINKKFKESNDIFDIIKNAKTSDNALIRISGIYKLALIKAKKFNISTFPFIEAQTFLQNIIPSICTTNAIVASLMILSRKISRIIFWFRIQRIL